MTDHNLASLPTIDLLGMLYSAQANFAAINGLLWASPFCIVNQKSNQNSCIRPEVTKTVA